MTTNENTNGTKDNNEAPIAEVSATEAESVAGGIGKNSQTPPIVVTPGPMAPLPTE